MEVGNEDLAISAVIDYVVQSPENQGRIGCPISSSHTMLRETDSISEGSSAPTQIRLLNFSFSRKEKLSSVGCAER